VTEFFDSNPALQAAFQGGIAPFVVALIVALVLARTRFAWLAIVAAYATQVALSTGFNFTPLSARLTPQRVVEILDAVFTNFDSIADRLGLEKIKTIGDCYMAVSGAPLPRPDHAMAAQLCRGGYSNL